MRRIKLDGSRTIVAMAFGVILFAYSVGPFATHASDSESRTIRVPRNTSKSTSQTRPRAGVAHQRPAQAPRGQAQNTAQARGNETRSQARLRVHGGSSSPASKGIPKLTRNPFKADTLQRRADLQKKKDHQRTRGSQNAFSRHLNRSPLSSVTRNRLSQPINESSRTRGSKSAASSRVPGVNFGPIGQRSTLHNPFKKINDRNSVRSSTSNRSATSRSSARRSSTRPQNPFTRHLNKTHHNKVRRR